MSFPGRLMVALAVVFASVPTARSQTVIVPDDFPTIQSAVDSGANVVQVRPGTYPESVTLAHAVTLTVSGLGGRPTITPPVGKDAFRFIGPSDRADRFSDMEVTDLDIVGGRYGIYSRTHQFTHIRRVTVTGSQKGVLIRAGTRRFTTRRSRGRLPGPAFA